MSNTERPPFNKPLKVSGSDSFGEWSMTAFAVPYNKGSWPNQLRKVYRWLDADGNIVDDVERWSEK